MPISKVRPLSELKSEPMSEPVRTERTEPPGLPATKD